MLSSLRFSLFFTALLIHPEEPGFENQIDQIPEQEQQDKRMFFPSFSYLIIIIALFGGNTSGEEADFDLYRDFFIKAQQPAPD